MTQPKVMIDWKEAAKFGIVIVALFMLKDLLYHFIFRDAVGTDYIRTGQTFLLLGCIAGSYLFWRDKLPRDIYLLFVPVIVIVAGCDFTFNLGFSSGNNRHPFVPSRFWIEAVLDFVLGLSAAFALARINGTQRNSVKS